MLYNGAIGLPMDKKSRQAYHDFKQQQRQYNASTGESETRRLADDYAALQEKTRQQNHRQKAIQFATPDVTANSVTEPQPRAQYASNTRRALVGPLGLYGQLPQVTPHQTSPLDSPDNLRQITFATEGADFDPDIDPTGTLLVYASTQHRATADLYLKRINGTALQQLTNDPSNDVMPAFTPDGRRLAFASDRAGNWDIYLMDIAGGQPTQLTNDQTHELSPSFSPDGRQLVYCTYGSQSGQWELVVIDVENPAVKRFIGYGLFPEWSPVDNRIVFQRARERGTRWFSIWIVEMVNGEGVRPTEIAASSNAAASQSTQIAGHGNRVASHVPRVRTVYRLHAGR